ncbi:MAG: peptidylprolyl isomerase [Oscillatoriales cyanobacterium SM2_2_1]|nr:peptidylprolyl isomerase [Oscillatoriales cyanobacterium SM2_2_1]
MGTPLGHNLAIALTCLGLLLNLWLALPGSSEAALPKQSAIKDARILLRNALPIEDANLRTVQVLLEKMPRQANLKRWSSLAKDTTQVEQMLRRDQQRLINAVAADRQEFVRQQITTMLAVVPTLQQAITDRDRGQIKPLSEQILGSVGAIEAALVPAFPYVVPDAYAHLPQLKGRAEVEFMTKEGRIVATIDGYSAPVNAGNFIDLVRRGFYDGLDFNRADDGYFLQIGDPDGAADGFIDPATGILRTVPLEIRIPQQTEPIYEHTLEEMGYGRTLPVLPFSAYGTLAMAHAAEEVNTASSQFFFYLFESDLTPAGLNLMDGNYSVFGYVTEGEEMLYKLRLGDKILSARVISGLENLQLPASETL